MEAILIPTDFSDAANNATEYGVELAKYFAARIILVNAYPVPAPEYEMGLSLQMADSLRQASEEALLKLKRDICERHQRNFDIECISEMGTPYGVISEAAKKCDIELIVMGIVGESGKLKEHLIGSNAVRVARHLEVPTIIVPERVRYHRIKKMAFACDLEKTEESTLLYIVKYFAHVFGADLEVINIEKPSEELSEAKAKSSILIENKLKTIKHQTIFATDENVVHGLKIYLTTHPTDIVMVNPKKHNIFHNLFQPSVTKDLAFHLELPILAIH